MTLPRYPDYRPSGVEWLGDIPSHWEALPMRRLLTHVEQGWSPTADDRLAADDDEWGVLKLGAVFRGRFRADQHKALMPETVPETRYEVRVGDLLVTRANTLSLVGDACVVESTRPRLMLSDLIYRLGVRADLVDSRYLSFFLLSEGGRAQIMADARGTSMSMAKVSGAHLRSWLVTSPPTLEEQRTIVEFLDRETAKIDALVAEQERLIELLREKRQAVISHSVTKGLNPDAPMKDSAIEWLGEIPEAWDVRPLKHVARIQTGLAKGKDHAGRRTIEVPYLRVANVQDGFLDLSDIATMQIPEEDLGRYKLVAGDVLMNEGGDFDKLGRGAVWNAEVTPCISQNHVFAVRCHRVRPEWLSAYTSGRHAQFFFMSRSKQSTNLASISSMNLMELPVPVPPDDEAAHIVAHVAATADRIDRLMSDAQRLILVLQERRTAVISAAVTGQIDVRDVAASRAA
jgi:type I restriction enzyme S subunit